ncbi:urate hydroxylase PuuD [Methylobacterium brachythecii]|uniref:Cysteine desulfurase n=1 Tax=Methylobacterium brachythecii TaxID=1176177 RepID=A0A7W6F8C8_9HYPH|nr:urate hydroxylase PuuD [Methylobacterium brachythecii]MBB3903996.1 putative membrane protein [Methylobacterium brachythecii]GLS42737.1 cysteine desulfurase [Methylobacterium brachythecii]
MDSFVWEYGSLLLRWLHIIAAMAWIGSSFFFMHLDASLKRTPDIPAGEGAAAWQVHGGGFYEMRKFFVAPSHMSPDLTWHKWQAYTTWLSGFVLLAWVYYAQSKLYLVDPAVLDLSPASAIGLGVGALAVGWAIYDGICRSPLGRNEGTLAAIGLVVITAAAYGFTQVFSGRGALIHTGALMATWMAGNVFLIIIPNQRKVVASLMKGEKPDPALGKQAKQRSMQNNYLTLPVVLLMISNHYPMLFDGRATIPLVVALITASGAVIRYFYNVRHADHDRSPWWAWGAAAAGLAAAFAVALTGSAGGRSLLGLPARAEVSPTVVTASAAPTPTKVSALSAPPEHVVELVMGRCAMCHAAEPAFDGIRIAPKGVLLDSEGAIARQAQAIRHQAVLTHSMPPNNVSEMTLDERAQIAAWLENGR